MDFTELVDIAGERLGGAVLIANDEFFAPKDNLLKSSKPVFIEGKYTDAGKWMDGWETRRRRTPGHDWCIVRLGLPGIIRGVVVDTSHFKGNYPEQCSIEACALEGHPGIEILTGPSVSWVEILPKSALEGDRQNLFPTANSERATHVRFNIFPDGGVARLKIYGDVAPDWKRLARSQTELDLAAVENGALVIACSDMFFGSRHNLIMPGPARNMADGWETRRRRGPGHDWVVIKLGTAGTIHRVEVDTSHFKGNAPDGCSIEGCCVEKLAVAGGQPVSQEGKQTISHSQSLTLEEWREIVPRTKLQPNTRHVFEDVGETGPVTHVRLNIFPDGGVSRLRLFGRLEKPPTD